MCHACRMPLSSGEKQHPAYRPGISCPKCIDNLSEAQIKVSDRQTQVELAKQRGEAHIGSFQDMNEVKTLGRVTISSSYLQLQKMPLCHEGATCLTRQRTNLRTS